MQQKTQVMYKEVQKAIFDKAENPKDKQPFRIMHCWLYLKVCSQQFYRVFAKGLQNTSNKRRAVDIDSIVGNCQAKQGSGGSPIWQFTTTRGLKSKNSKNEQKFTHGNTKSATQALENINESFAVKSIVFRDVNDDALFSRPSRQLDIISQGYFKIRKRTSVIGDAKTCDKITERTAMFNTNTCDIITS